MACEACSVKFNLFKRKKQCIDCLRYFCSECVIKRVDKMFSCDTCCLLSRRPLVRSQVTQMRSRDLRQYLLAKKISIKGCIEKEDLVSVLMQFANGSSNCPNVESTSYIRTENLAQETVSDRQSSPSHSSPDISNVQASSPPEAQSEATRTDNIEIEEISSGDCSSNEGPEPLITEQDDVSETSNVQHPGMFTEIPVWSDIVKLSDINELANLEYLSVKQLKNLLSTNRVDYKGCVERHELLDRASRLWEEHKQSRADVEALDEGDLCKICWDAPIECVILECGHMACCIACGKQMSECPICKQYVVRVVRFFKA